MNNEIWNIIGKKVKGDITDGELDSLKTWLSENAENQEILNDTLTIWEKTEGLEQNQKLDTDQEWKDFKTYKFDREEESSTNHVDRQENQTKQVSLFPAWLYRIAAILVLGVGLTYYFNVFKDDSFEIVYTTIHKSSDQKLKIALPDQSEIWLNRFSEVSYSEGFGSSHRTLQLKGEAFFDVQKSNLTFIILGNQSQTEVMGTAFNVRSIETEPSTEVVVVRGKVAFSGNKVSTKKIILTRGEKAVLNLSTNRISKSINSDSNFLSWKEEVLIFDQTSFDQVIKTLQTYFDIKISLENDQLLNCHFTGKFDEPQLIQVLEILSASMGFKYQIKDNTVSITGNGCP